MRVQVCARTLSRRFRTTDFIDVMVILNKADTWDGDTHHAITHENVLRDMWSDNREYRHR